MSDMSNTATTDTPTDTPAKAKPKRKPKAAAKAKPKAKPKAAPRDPLNPLNYTSLTEKQIIAIAKSKAPAKVAAEKYGCTVSTVSGIRTGRTFSALTGVERQHRDMVVPSEATIKKIYKAKKGNMTELAAKYGVSRPVVSRIRRGKSYASVTAGLTPGLGS